MALRVWLPLIGDINNKGASIATVAVSGATVNNNGKLGKTYLFDASDDYISIDSAELRNCFKGGSNPFTLAMWVYNTKTTGSRAVLFGDYGLTGSSNFSIELNSSAGNWNNDVRLYWNGGGPDYRATDTNITTNTWVHLAIVYDGAKLCFYRNGTLINTRTNALSTVTKTSGAYYLGRDSRTGATAFGGYLNDFRVYDEALSAKEIREISKALVCHYKLEGVGANPNLCTGSEDGKPDNIDSVTYCNSVTSFGLDSVQNCYKLITPVSGNQNNGIGFYYPTSDTTLSIAYGQTITFSCDIKGSNSDLTYTPKLAIRANFGSDGTWYSGTYLWAWTNDIINLSNAEYQRYYITCTLPSENENYTSHKLWFCVHAGYGATFYIKNIKIEKGNKMTSWIPASTDALYTSLGYDKMLLTDVSGNGYNASLIGSLNCNLNAPRYQSSTKFDGSANYLAIGRPMPRDALTVNVWAYMDNWANYNSRIASCTEGGGWNFEPTSGGMNFALGVGASSNAYMNNFTSAQAPLSGISAGWHMFTGTFDGMYKKLYIDGVLKGSTNGCQNGTTLTTATPIFYNANNGVFIGAEAQGSQTTATSPYFNGSISDFRIYATALSAEDILALYQVSLALSKANNMYAYEFTTDASNLVSLANVAIAQNKIGSYGVNRFEQTNCKVTLENGYLKVYRTPNIDRSAWNMWGGIRLKPNYNGDVLLKGHTYIMLYDAKGQTSNAQGSFGWSNRMDWGGGGLMPAPTNVSYRIIPTNFNSDNWETFWYKWDLTDDVRKVCTSSYGSYVEGETYLSYNDFQVGWGYESTGELGTSIYVRNFRLYDITDINNPKFLKTGITMSDEINELDDYVKIRKIGYDANSFIEI